MTASRKCPYCFKANSATALSCHHCQRDLETTLQDAPEEPERVVYRPTAAPADEEAPTLTRDPGFRTPSTGAAARRGMVRLVTAVASGATVGLLLIGMALLGRSCARGPTVEPRPEPVVQADAG